MRQQMLLAAGALVVAAPLVACGASSPGLRAATTHTGSSSLTVATAVSPRADGKMYVEGALAEVRLRAADGRVIATKRADPGRLIVFHGLPSGRYTVEPALRPCEGSCAALDPRTDACRGAVPVSGHATVVVRFTVESPCVVAPVRAPGSTGRTDG
jgi:hypothetical protein